MASDNPLERLVKRRHPDHSRSLHEWQFIRSTLEDTPEEYAGKHLYKHPKENHKVYAARKERAADHRYNHSIRVLNTYTGYLFQQAPTLAANLPVWLADFVASGDMDGRPLVELAKDLTFWSLANGIEWVGVDRPMADGQELTKAQAQELGIKTYAYLMHPENVLDGKIDKGRVKWLLVQEDKRDDEDPMTSTGALVTKWRLWTEQAWILIHQVKSAQGGVTYAIKAEGANPIGRVPFVPVRYGSGSGFACPGLLAEIAHLDKSIFNTTSLLDEILYAVTFPQLGIPYKGELYEQTGEDADGPVYSLTAEGQGVMEMGLHSAIPFNSEAGAPVYITPPSEPANLIITAITRLITILLSLALMDGEEGTPDGEAKAAASGVSKAYTFDKLNKRLATIAGKQEAAWRQVFEIVALWEGESAAELPDVPWDFPDSFEVESLAQEIEEFMALLGGNPPSATAKAEVWKRILRKALPKLDEEIWSKIDDEIDSSAGDMGLMAQGLASIVAGAQVQEPEKEQESEEEGGDAVTA